MGARTVGPAAYRRDRRRLLEQLQDAGIDDLAVLHAFDCVPRHLFVPEAVRHRAYEDAALPIGEGQTISRPGVHALCLSLAALGGRERVLEIGTGSGFQTALLSVLAEEVYTVETIPALARRARIRLAEFGAPNVHLRVGDGSAGWKKHAPYDVILVAAAAPRIPPALHRQLAEGGRLIAPVGEAGRQELVKVTREADGFTREVVRDARFVPLVGEEGW